MKCRNLLVGLVFLSLVAACSDDRSAAARKQGSDPNQQQGDAEPQVVTMIRQAEDAYANFLQKHEAARRATRARLSLDAASPEQEAFFLQVREEEALAARTQAAEAKLAMRRTVDAYKQGTDFERAQVAAFLRRSNLREEIRARALAAELFASDDSRRAERETAEHDMDAYRQRLAKEEADWQAVLNQKQQAAKR